MRAGLDSQQQRLRVGDLGHFRRRREAFEGGFEDVVGVEGAVRPELSTPRVRVR
jgi:hypothetical protein